jgi:hypothetical protein
MRRSIGAATAIALLLVFPVQAAYAASSVGQFPLVTELESFAANVVSDVEQIAQEIGQGLAALTGNTPSNKVSYSASAAAAATATPPAGGRTPASNAYRSNLTTQTAVLPSPVPASERISRSAATSQPVGARVNVFAIQSALGLLAARVQGLSALLTAQASAAPPYNIESQIAALQSAISSQRNYQGYSASASVPLGGGAPKAPAREPKALSRKCAGYPEPRSSLPSTLRISVGHFVNARVSLTAFRFPPAIAPDDTVSKCAASPLARPRAGLHSRSPEEQA